MIETHNFFRSVEYEILTCTVLFSMHYLTWTHIFVSYNTANHNVHMYSAITLRMACSIQIFPFHIVQQQIIT